MRVVFSNCSPLRLTKLPKISCVFTQVCQLLALNFRHDKKDNCYKRQGYNTKVVQITGKATAGILHPGMESASETGYGKIGESAKKSHKNDSGLQGFELRGTVDKVWANNAGEKEEQRRLNRSL